MEKPDNPHAATPQIKQQPQQHDTEGKDEKNHGKGHGFVEKEKPGNAIVILRKKEQKALEHQKAASENSFRKKMDRLSGGASVAHTP